MQSKKLSRRILLVTVIIVFIIFSVFIFYFIQQRPTLVTKSLEQGEPTKLTEDILISPEEEQPTYGLPVRLKIPSINVDAIVEYVGLTQNGAMDIPKKYASVAWYNLGPRPGEIGNAVIDGHYGWEDGKESIFNNLYKLRKGDKLYIEDDKGEVISFVVREARRYDPEDEASAVFVSNDEKSHLNIITCEGLWNKVSKSYSKRLVVFADKE